MQRLSGLAACILAAGVLSCASREQRIEKMSISFMVKGPLPKARRSAELAELIRLGAIRRGMTPEEVKLVLGEPSFIWEDAPQVDKDAGYQRQYVYRLGPGEGLRLDFSASGLERARRHVEGPWESGGGLFDIELPERHSK